MKRLAIYGLVVLVLLVGGVMLTMDSLARTAIQKGVEAGLGVPTSVGSVSLRPLLGRFSMNDLEISNPEGYTGDHLLKLGRVETQISYAALRRSEIELEQLLLSDLDVDLEWQGRKANYQALGGGGSGGGGGGGGGSAESSSEGQTRFVIDQLVVKNVVARLRLGAAGSGEVKIPELRLQGIGRASGGATMAQVSRQVVAAIVTAVLKEGKSLGPAFAAKAGPALESLRGLGKEGGSTAEKAGKLLKGLFDRGGDDR